MTFVAPNDAAFLLSEAREHPTHIGGLLTFRLPPGSGPEFVDELYSQLMQWDRVRPVLRRRPATPGPIIGGLLWHDDNDIDLDYHVRRSALPRPGEVKELLTLVSRLHASLLDRHRPLWEFHLIEGLTDNRFAVYYKVHHALVDGINVTRQIARMFSPDPAIRNRPPLWAELTEPPDKSLDTVAQTTITTSAPPWGFAAAMVSKAGEAAATVKPLSRLVVSGLRGRDAILPFQAPHSMFNVPLSGARRYAAQSWPLQRLRSVATGYGATINDVLLAVCAGALRRYLLEADALPSQSLIAAVPVALPVERDTESGNAITMVLCRLATDIEDPAARVAEIRASMLAAKEAMKDRTALQISLFGLATTVVPAAITTIPGVTGRLRPPFNLIISNVPGPRSVLYWNGALLEGWFPVSAPSEGLALNITVCSYAGTMGFGLIGCRRSVPHLQTLLRHLEASLTELEETLSP